MKVMSELDHLCTKSDAAQVVSQLLHQFDVVAGSPPGPILDK
jgi:hypothetical protein